MSKRFYKCMEFELSNGETMTARDVAEKYDVPLGTTRTRLSNGVRDVALLSKQPLSHKRSRLGDHRTRNYYVKEETVKERRLKRNTNDPMSKLFLKMA